MKALLLNGSPKKKGSTSGLLSRMMGCLLSGWDVQYASLRTEQEYPQILARLKDVDVLLLAAPLYVGGIPSHVLRFLKEAEQTCLAHECHLTLYVLSNNGFIEGIQSRSCLRMYQCWCRRASVTWGGGIGIGGGEMFYILSLYFPVLLTVMAVFRLIGYGAGAAPALSDWIFLAEDLAIYLFFNCGIFSCMVWCAFHIRRLRPMKECYTRVMVPAFLFIPLADIFMAITAIANGKRISSLFEEDTSS